MIGPGVAENTATVLVLGRFWKRHCPIHISFRTEIRNVCPTATTILTT